MKVLLLGEIKLNHLVAGTLHRTDVVRHSRVGPTVFKSEVVSDSNRCGDAMLWVVGSEEARSGRQEYSTATQR